MSANESAAVAAVEHVAAEVAAEMRAEAREAEARDNAALDAARIAAKEEVTIWADRVLRLETEAAEISGRLAALSETVHQLSIPAPPPVIVEAPEVPDNPHPILPQAENLSAVVADLPAEAAGELPAVIAPAAEKVGRKRRNWY